MIRIYEEGSYGYRALAAAAEILTLRSKRGTQYSVGDTYFDFGQDWKWTTIIAQPTKGLSWQVLSPKEHSLIVEGGGEIDILLAVNSVWDSEYNPDRDN